MSGFKNSGKKMVFAGIDPSAKSQNASGVCLLDSRGKILLLERWKTFRELGSKLAPFSEEIKVIGIDGPLQPPFELQRCCFSEPQPICDHCQTTPFKGRYCEYILNRNGFRCFLTSKHSFARSWAARCFELNDYLIGLGYRTIEVYPGAARKILFPQIIGKKQLRSSRQQLQEAFRQRGFSFPDTHRLYSHDELDALLAAFTALLHSRGETVSVGDSWDGFIVLPHTKIEYPETDNKDSLKPVPGGS